MNDEKENTHPRANGEAAPLSAAEQLLELPDAAPWEEPVNGKALLDELAAGLRHLVVLPKWVPEATALWTVHTHAYRLRAVTTYLGIESPEHRCGKSTLLDVLGLLVYRAVRTANISTPAFYRTIAVTEPTLLIDEADTFLQSEDLRGILNSGYRQLGAFVVRMTNEARKGGGAAGAGGGGKGNGGGGNGNGGGGASTWPVKFSSWCPKAIARIGRLPRALEDRCILIRMERKLPSERCGRLQEVDTTRLRRQCVRFVQDNAEGIRQAQPGRPPELNDRAAEIWEPLLAVADLAGGDWPERARQAAVALSLEAQDGDPMGSLLMDIAAWFLRSDQQRCFSRTLVQWLEGFKDRPWMELKKGKTTELWLARQLRPYGVFPKTMRIGGERAKGYEKEDFGEVFRRYIPQSEVEAFKAEIKREVESQKGKGEGEKAEGGANGSEKKEGGGESANP